MKTKSTLVSSLLLLAFTSGSLSAAPVGTTFSCQDRLNGRRNPAKRPQRRGFAALSLALAAMLVTIDAHYSPLHAQGTAFTALTITNPTPESADNFGYSLAAVGTDRVLIGAYSDDTGASGTGAAYLFDTNGALLATFTNPTPAAADYFGYSLTAVGTDRVLIGAYLDDTGARNTGAAYLFSTNGALLTIFTNPTPEEPDYFGYSLAAVGNDWVLIGAYRDNTGEWNAGAAYLFSVSPGGGPALTLLNPGCAGTNFTFSFLSQSNLTYTVEFNDDLGTTNWQSLETLSGDNTIRQYVVPMTNRGQRLFRVRQP